MTDRSPIFTGLLDSLFADVERIVGHPLNPVDIERELEQFCATHARDQAQLERMRTDLRAWVERRTHNSN